jgi:dTDP-4-amino-4,6-dideoxygalactose transaminase
MKSEEDPILPNPLHVGKPNIGNRERFIERLEGIFERGWLTNAGPLVQEFEQRLADYLGVKHCIATCNGTVALELAIRATGLKGEVILPSLTFIATAHSLQWQEIRPVFCDIDPQTFNIDPFEVERHITPQTTGILGVHLYGRPCDVEGLQAVADKHNLKLLFDAAHAFGCSHKGRMVGNFGNCEVFSFHATKLFNSFEGGAVATNDDELAQKIRLMKNFGFAGEDNVVHVGTNGKMTEVCAAMGLTNLESLEEFVAINKRNLAAYHAGLAGAPGIEFIHYDEAERNNFQYVILRVDAEKFGFSRDDLQQELRRHNVLARRYFYPGCHRMEPYRTLYPEAGRHLARTEDFCGRVLALPTGTQVSEETVGLICEGIRNFQENGSVHG